VNVSIVAENFGGGGHKCASGCSMDAPLEVAVARIVERLRDAVGLGAESSASP
jgi:phosphoesterase RecJ-like protein